MWPCHSRSVCALLERCFGQSFDDVRVHKSCRASATAQAVGAKAFAPGRDISFNAGRYNTESFGGRFLLGPEVAQMRVNPSSEANQQINVSQEIAVEREADQLAPNSVTGLGSNAPQRSILLGAR